MRSGFLSGLSQYQQQDMLRGREPMGLQLPKWLIKLPGELSPRQYLFWVLCRPHHVALTGEHTREVIDAVQPGDILLRRHDGCVNTMLTPGSCGSSGSRPKCWNIDERIESVSIAINQVRTDGFVKCFLNICNAVQGAALTTGNCPGRMEKEKE